MICVVSIDWFKATKRCVCGSCNHHITKVKFSNGFTWTPTNSEFVAIKESLKLCLLHNLSTDKHCFKAKQIVDHRIILDETFA